MRILPLLYPVHSPWRPVILLAVMAALALTDNYVQQLAVTNYLESF